MSWTMPTGHPGSKSKSARQGASAKAEEPLTAKDAEARNVEVTKQMDEPVEVVKPTSKAKSKPEVVPAEEPAKVGEEGPELLDELPDIDEE